MTDTTTDNGIAAIGTAMQGAVRPRPARWEPIPEPKCKACDDMGVLFGFGEDTKVCPCGAWRRRHVALWKKRSGIPAGCRGGFATWQDGGNATLAQARARTEEWAESFDPKAHGGGMLMNGMPGCGKSHLAGAAAWRAVERGMTARFMNVCETMARIRWSFDHPEDEDESEIVQGALEADVLVLDDVGAEKATEFVVERLFLIVNGRLAQRRATLVTTNLDARGLADRLGLRLSSRLLEVAPAANRISFAGVPDYRSGGL